MTNVNELLRAVCVELGFRLGFLKINSPQSRVSDNLTAQDALVLFVWTKM